MLPDERQPDRDAPLNFREPESTAMLRDTLRRFVEQEMPREKARAWDKDNHFPRDVFRKLGELGVMGLTVPEEYGGAGRDIVGCMVAIEELARRSCAIAIPYIMSACYAGMNLLECASEKRFGIFHHDPRLFDLHPHACGRQFGDGVHDLREQGRTRVQVLLQPLAVAAREQVGGQRGQCAVDASA